MNSNPKLLTFTTAARECAMQMMLNAAYIQRQMLFLLGERGKDVIKQCRGGADEFAGISFHRQSVADFTSGGGKMAGDGLKSGVILQKGFGSIWVGL